MFSTDACNSGGAGFYGGDWFYVHGGADEPRMCDSHINEKELYTILLTAPPHRLLSCDTSESCYVCYVFSENVGKEWHRRTSLARHSHGCARCKSVVCTPRLAVCGCVYRTLRKWRPYSHVLLLYGTYGARVSLVLACTGGESVDRTKKKFYMHLKFYGVSACSKIRRILYGGGHILDSEASLDTDIRRFRSGVYAESTNSTYRSQRRAYLRFCIYHKYVPVPATSKNICRGRIREPSTGQLATANNSARNPPSPWRQRPTKASDNSILRAIHNKLDFSRAYHVVFWAACVVAFFSFFRKSNVLPKTAKDFDATKQLCRRDFRFFDRAVEKAFSLTDTAKPDGPAFVLPQETGPGFTPLTHKPFVTTLRTLLRQCGYPDSAYSGHSFRRGGATWASECGLPPELIKLQGDWKSSAYQRYTSVSLKGRLWTRLND
ncbi:hypothetical protein Bbelb_303910 [Branchiostoma belcheri]|nr:hypothetical protein Bbelb_303910 [Branchiostoma belcheri]